MLRNASISVGSAIGSLTWCSKPAQVLQRVRHALQEMRFALIESPESIRPQRLQNAHVHIRVVVLHKRFALQST